jgi:hypothetical protein
VQQRPSEMRKIRRSAALVYEQLMGGEADEREVREPDKIGTPGCICRTRSMPADREGWR